MKKKFIFMAALAAMFSISFTSCSNDDEIASAPVSKQEGVNPMTFNGYLDGSAVTRGYAAAEGDVQTAGMSVWAFEEDKACSVATDFFMGGPTAGLAHTWDGTNNWYKATADYFWPEYNLNFVALTPQTGGGIGAITMAQAASDKPLMTVAVSVPLTTESAGTYGSDTQMDIMIASIESQAPLTTGSAALTFKHALSQIVFKGIVDEATTIHKATVKSIKLVNIASDGTISYDADNDVFNTGSFGTANQQYAANIVNADVTSDDPAAADDITGQDDNASGRNYQLMILPQTSVACTEDADGDPETDPTAIAAGDLNISTKTAPVAGTYLLVNADLYANGDNVNKLISSDTDVYIPLESTTWAPGYKYTYILKFGDNLLHPITFTATVDTWTDASKNVEF